MYIIMINETALVCGRFLSPLCKAVKMHVILFFLEQDGEGRGVEGSRAVPSLLYLGGQTSCQRRSSPPH